MKARAARVEVRTISEDKALDILILLLVFGYVLVDVVQHSMD